MRGTNQIILNEATICDMVQRHMNEHVLKDGQVVTEVRHTYVQIDGVNQEVWVARIDTPEKPSEIKT